MMSLHLDNVPSLNHILTNVSKVEAVVGFNIAARGNSLPCYPQVLRLFRKGICGMWDTKHPIHRWWHPSPTVTASIHHAPVSQGVWVCLYSLLYVWISHTVYYEVWKLYNHLRSTSIWGCVRRKKIRLCNSSSNLWKGVKTTSQPLKNDTINIFLEVTCGQRCGLTLMRNVYCIMINLYYCHRLTGTSSMTTFTVSINCLDATNSGQFPNPKKFQIQTLYPETCSYLKLPWTCPVGDRCSLLNLHHSSRCNSQFGLLAGHTRSVWFRCVSHIRNPIPLVPPLASTWHCSYSFYNQE